MFKIVFFSMVLFVTNLADAATVSNLTSEFNFEDEDCGEGQQCGVVVEPTNDEGTSKPNPKSGSGTNSGNNGGQD